MTTLKNTPENNAKVSVVKIIKEVQRVGEVTHDTIDNAVESKYTEMVEQGRKPMTETEIVIEWVRLNKSNKDLIERFMTSLSDRVDEIANETDADINRTLFRIVGNHIEVYEIDLSEEKVKSFLGHFKVENLKY
jgi:hypothetical protein